MQFNLSDIPFSRYGSYMSLNILPKEWNHPGIALRSMRTSSGIKEGFNLVPVKKGKEVPFTYTYSASQLQIKNGTGSISFCYEDLDVLRIRGSGMALQIRSCKGSQPTVFPNGENSRQIICGQNNTTYSHIPLSGDIQFQQVHHVRRQDKKQKAPTGLWYVADCGADGKDWEIIIHDFDVTPRKLKLQKSYAAAHKVAKAAWESFAKNTPTTAKKYSASTEQAMFVNYTSVIAANGTTVKRDTMLMSKNWMCQCWSWDHCINAMAHAKKNPQLAWDLFQGPFDHQDANGCLPDSYNGQTVGRSFTKPPIHGWTLGCMRRENKKLLTPERARLAEKQLIRWTNWWLNHRDSDGDGLPEYRHGNDSGWDNGTVFDIGYPMVAPDLPAYLILQMDQIAELAEINGSKKRATLWRKKSDAMLARMCNELWTGEQFLAKQAFTNARPTEGDCLLNHIPIILGKRLPKKYRDHLIEALKPDGRFITKNGPATESPQSPLYVADGYWRGPIWGP
ncbi:MAG: hypothetical protein HRU15_14190, partial [Planctomycetes bacterium]|nr:hypothetical protein [Planctomycetota bacterium]